jgi:Protein of unknown function (DUF4232)
VIKPVLVATLAAIGLTICACSGGSATPQQTNTVTVTAAASTPAATTSVQPASSTPASSSGGGTAAAGCLTRYLNGSTGLSQGTAGAVEIAIVFKNLNNLPCTLYGFPGVAQATGTSVTDVGQPSFENHSTARELVTLQPGGFANATLQISFAGNYAAKVCRPVHADWLAVIPPNQTVPLYIHYSSTACRGLKVQLLSVTAVRPGNGG